MEERTPVRREKAAAPIRSVTKRRILDPFDPNHTAHIAQQGPTWSWRSGVTRSSRMTGTMQSELATMDNIGPGLYHLPPPRIINLHLDTQPRFQPDSTTADVRTELQLPGTEHLGPGYYGLPSPEVHNYLPMRSRVGRFDEDPRNVVTESAANELTGPGYIFVPQHHLFCNEDGSPKVSENASVSFNHGGRFSEAPEELEKRRWAESQGPLLRQDEHYRKESWESNGGSVGRLPRFMGYSHTLPLDAPEQVGGKGPAKLLGRTMLQTFQRRKKYATLKKGCGAARSALPRQLQPEARKPIEYFNSKVQHQATGPLAPLQRASQPRKAPVGTAARVALSRGVAAEAALSRSRSRSHSVLGNTVPRSQRRERSSSNAGVPRCASQLYTRNIDRSPVPISDGFLGIDRNVNSFTIDFSTSDRRNPFLSTSSREPQSNLLHKHQPSILTNGDQLGPGTYLGSPQ
eukprot:TRINITY_DN8705_c0_g1_i4.p1 TRINITY_DN8705_c0_g1~~TRINITY_DN8705_c0_g1_i4.p1  ORF type:complete len:460 (-),score=84.80 TRINITY_DN8705_c0_g1_i4:354-1733(-)